MATSRFSALCFGCSVLLLMGACEESAEIRGAAGQAGAAESQEAQEMIGALHDILEKLRNSRLPSMQKKFGWVPSCDAGEPCAVRKGARIGKLCDCPRGTTCNLYILKCL
ncbi:cocaine- and amphetamine-regulated transcript protein-like [Elgaria multicarinata webbii]|uniref:cocaine- and amphetamine-regulated transcript protein-like n=1 Tax=Elgaria multicarinata webbii TaxID=159646 RepID=UPI002FCCC0A2